MGHCTSGELGRFFVVEVMFLGSSFKYIGQNIKQKSSPEKIIANYWIKFMPNYQSVMCFAHSNALMFSSEPFQTTHKVTPVIPTEPPSNTKSFIF